MKSPWIVLVLVACGTHASERGAHDTRDNTHDKPGATSPVAATPAFASAPHPVEISEPPIALPRELAFELLDSGKPGKQDARAPLRYALVPGASRFVTRSELTSRELVDGTWREPTRSPPTTSELGVKVERGGHVVMRAANANELAIALDERGRTSELAAHATDAEDIVQRMLATVVPLPEQPLGLGARWRVVTALRQQGAVLKQTATYTLVARGPRWTIAVDVQRLAEPQRVMGVELVAIVRRLQGTFEVDPRQPFPHTGKLTVTSTVHARTGSRETIVEDTGTIELQTYPQR